MIKKHCNFCAAEHWHNPMGKKATTKEPEYRCTNCGWPRRYSPNKNNMLRLVRDGRVGVVV